MRTWLVLVASLALAGCNSSSTGGGGSGGEGATGGDAATGGNPGAGGAGASAGRGGGAGAGGSGAGGDAGAGGGAGTGGRAGSGGSTGGGGSAGVGGAGGEAGAGGAPDLCSGIDCNDSNPCTDDVCDPEAGCVHTPKEDGSVCGLDAECASGSCNLCPKLFVINPVPRTIRDGNDSTLVETRGQETDGVPMPVNLTLSALWGTFENTEISRAPDGVVSQNATYVCDRPGPVEVCVEASDGACAKNLCDQIVCPDTVGEP